MQREPRFPEARAIDAEGKRAPKSGAISGAEDALYTVERHTTFVHRHYAYGQSF
jgi:hypothetical protein